MTLPPSAALRSLCRIIYGDNAAEQIGGGGEAGYYITEAEMIVWRDPACTRRPRSINKASWETATHAVEAVLRLCILMNA